MPLEKLTRQRMVQALNVLGELAEQEGVQLELCLYGGSALLLAYGSRESSKDIDAIIRPSDIGQRLVKAVAERLGLHPEWLNDDVKRFVSDLGTFAPLQIEELEDAAKRQLKITRASAGYLLAMKCLACRLPIAGYPGDIEDLRFLIHKTSIRTIEQVEREVGRFYPNDALTLQSKSIIEGLLREENSR